MLKKISTQGSPYQYPLRCKYCQNLYVISPYQLRDVNKPIYIYDFMKYTLRDFPLHLLIVYANEQLS